MRFMLRTNADVHHLPDQLPKNRLARSVGLEFPRFGGHLLTEFVSVGKDVCYAKDSAVFTGVSFGGRAAVAQ